MVQPHSTARPRRLRHHASLRALVTETRLSVQNLVLPLFIKANKSDGKQAILSMPGHFQLTLEDLDREIKEIVQLGICAVLLFGIPEYKDSTGSAALQSNGVIQQAIARIKQIAPDLLVLTDLCFCEYTDHGHCGVLHPTQEWTVDNDATLALLIEQALSHAKVGADVIAPSGMMDGAIGAIRSALDQSGYSYISLLGYSVKYASALYGPFREAAESAPQTGDRKGYQMNPANSREALYESSLDVQEGVDILMVKPAGFYLDVIYRVKQTYPHIPLAAYQVSGEFSMIKAASANGWLDEKQAALESLLSIKRAGADFIITYFAKDAVRWLA